MSLLRPGLLIRVPPTQSAFPPRARRNAFRRRDVRLAIQIVCDPPYDEAGNVIETHEHARRLSHFAVALRRADVIELLA